MASSDPIPYFEGMMWAYGYTVKSFHEYVRISSVSLKYSYIISKKLLNIDEFDISYVGQRGEYPDYYKLSCKSPANIALQTNDCIITNIRIRRDCVKILATRFDLGGVTTKTYTIDVKAGDGHTKFHRLLIASIRNTHQLQI